MTQLLGKVATYLKKSAPVILSCLGVLGVAGTTVLAVKATTKATRVIDEMTGFNNDGIVVEPPTVAKIKLCWKFYVPTVVTGATTIACILGSSVLSKKSQASLASAYGLVSESFRRYRHAANEVYGEDADSRIKAQIAKDAQVATSVWGYSLYSLDEDVGSERVLFYDMFSQRYFITSLAAVLNAEYHANRNLMLRGFIPLNEFYELIGVDPIPIGDDFGWRHDEMFDLGLFWLDFDNTKTVMDDGMECYAISAEFDPVDLTKDPDD